MLKLITIDNKPVWVAPNKIESIHIRELESTKEKEKKTVWQIVMPNTALYLDKNSYSEEALIMACCGDTSLLIEENEEIDKPKEEEKGNYVEPLPYIISRWDFIYCKTEWGYAYDFILGDNPCYLMDGDPLTVTGVKIPSNVALVLLEYYDYDDKVRNLSWIEINGQWALLFNNRAK